MELGYQLLLLRKARQGERLGLVQMLLASRSRNPIQRALNSREIISHSSDSLFAYTFWYVYLYRQNSLICLTVFALTSSGILQNVKNLSASAGEVRDNGLIPESGRSPGGGHSNALQYSCLENPMNRGSWQATVHGVAESDTTEWQPAYTCVLVLFFFLCQNEAPWGQGSLFYSLMYPKCLCWCLEQWVNEWMDEISFFESQCSSVAQSCPPLCDPMDCWGKKKSHKDFTISPLGKKSRNSPFAEIVSL